MSQEHDIKGLEQQIRALHESVTKLYAAKHGETLASTIHRPGWTSKPEFALVQGHVKHLQQSISGIHEAFDALVAAAKQIGEA
jgi:hypothetical protein